MTSVRRFSTGQPQAGSNASAGRGRAGANDADLANLRKLADAGVTGFSVKKINPDARLSAPQIAAGVFGVGLFGWGITVAVIIFICAFHYVFVTVADTREWYVVNGAATWAQAEIERTLSSAIAARQAARGAFCRDLIQMPSDTAGFERAMMPHLLNKQSALREVSFTFSDRLSVLSVSRSRANDGRWESVLQSNAQDCYLLGLTGCADIPRVRIGWYLEGAGMQGDSLTWANDTDTPCSSPYNSSAIEAMQWEDEPALMERALDDDGYVDKAAEGIMAWFPSHSLLFRTGFYFNQDDPGAYKIDVVGRATVELGELSGDRLKDIALGEGGRIFLCSSSGAVLSSQKPQDIIKIQPPVGILSLKKAWELKYPFASQLQQAFPGAGKPPTELRLPDAMAAVIPLRVPFDHFAVLVIAPEQGAFRNDLLFVISIIGFLVSTTPFIGTFFGVIVFMARQWFILFSAPQKNPYRRDSFGGGARLSVMSRLGMKAGRMSQLSDFLRRRPSEDRNSTRSSTSEGGMVEAPYARKSRFGSLFSRSSRAKKVPDDDDSD